MAERVNEICFSVYTVRIGAEHKRELNNQKGENNELC